MLIIISAFIYLQLMHFLFDFVLQPPVMFLNKGNIKHIGGYLHAGLMALIIIPILLYFNISLDIIFFVFVIEFASHYAMDWFKTNANMVYNLDPKTTKEYWYLLGFDQFVHQSIYILIVYICFVQNGLVG